VDIKIQHLVAGLVNADRVVDVILQIEAAVLIYLNSDIAAKREVFSDVHVEIFGAEHDHVGVDPDCPVISFREKFFGQFKPRQVTDQQPVVLDLFPVPIRADSKKRSSKNW